MANVLFNLNTNKKVFRRVSLSIYQLCCEFWQSSLIEPVKLEKQYC